MSIATENNFRNAFSSFGAQGGFAATDSTTGSGSTGGAFGHASDWFGGVRSQVAGYVPASLGGSGGQPQEEDWLGLTWFQRMAGFALCVAGGVACFMIAFFVGLPMLVLSPSKFATSFTLGPMAHLKALTSRERLPFTGAYVGSMVFTLYASLIAKSFFLTAIGTIIEIQALAWYFRSYSPFTGRSIGLGSSMAGGLLPI
ncbi:hypothetical protein BC939DRAFT_500911 [Gamsiella multidivaricata]|uniref:uncharacterized protein n=1 Tax=Gamsiella multidivaricata TaxID=101098 RepID=UPI00221E7F00|nr:uncharacterized protein BC939DRAFT_500911 [Gamsiella multidivaricata]KAI7828258.1 hypothetical protein BC939DRAFT_500911 [Gamsiella multidivaricata]